MATDKPRITITLNPHVYATLKRMSEFGGQPMSSIISELLDSVHEPLMRTVAFLDAAAQAPKQVKDGLRQSFETVERELYGAVGYTVAQVDWLTEQLGKRGDGAAHSVAGTQGGATTGAQSRAGGGDAGDEDDSFEAYNNARMTRASGKANPHVVTRGSGITHGNKIKGLQKGKKGAKRG